jgi:hypothetical protein
VRRGLAIVIKSSQRSTPNRTDQRTQHVHTPCVAMKSEPGPPMTLGNAAAAGVRLIVWCRDCGHQVEPDPAHHACRYGAEVTVLDWREKLVCSRCQSRAVDMVVSGA